MSIYNDVFLIDQQLQNMQESACVEDVTEQQRILAETREYILNTGLEKLCKVRQNRKAEVEALKEEEKRIVAKRKAMENSLDWLEGYIADVFALSGEKKATYGTFTLSFRKSVKCVIDESVFNDERYQTIEEIRKIDKMAVKEALSAGEVIPGAELVEGQNLQIK